MQEAIVALVDELMETVSLPDAPYMELQWCLLTSHYADRHQRVEQLISIPPMAAQKTSELLAEMNRLSQGPGNQCILQLLFPYQADQAAAHPVLRGR